MRTVLLSLIIGAFVLLFVGLVAFSPYHFTSVAINDGISMPFLKLDRFPRSLVANSPYDWDQATAESSGDQLWEMIYLGNIQIDLPARHPLFLLSPKIKVTNTGEYFGLDYLDHSGRNLLQLMPLESTHWQTQIGLDDIFSLPIFVHYLQNIGDGQIWRDIFSRKIVDPLARFHSPLDIGKVFERSYEEMLYDIYILSLRKKYFPSGVSSFAIDDRNIGWLNVEHNQGEDEGRIFRDEWILVTKFGRVHRFHLRTRHNNAQAVVLRSHIVKSINFVSSDPDQTKIIHSRFQQLPLSDKTGQVGLTLLYSAWSHSPDQKEFLRELIQYSERGSKNEGLIGELYNYAFKKYGTNFSSITDKLLETAAERLKRKIKEDESKELEAFKRSKDYIPEEFGSEDERIEFFLNKARDDGDVEQKGVLEVP